MGGGGGGGKTPKCTDKNHVHVTYMCERATQKHYIPVSKHICIHIQSMQFSLFLVLWRYKRQYTNKILTLRRRKNMHMRASGASELRKFPSIFCWYFRYFVLDIYIFRSKIIYAYIYNQCRFLLFLMVWRYINDSVPTKH